MSCTYFTRVSSLDFRRFGPVPANHDSRRIGFVFHCGGQGRRYLTCSRDVRGKSIRNLPSAALDSGDVLAADILGCAIIVYRGRELQDAATDFVRRFRTQHSTAVARAARRATVVRVPIRGNLTIHYYRFTVYGPHEP